MQTVAVALSSLLSVAAVAEAAEPAPAVVTQPVAAKALSVGPPQDKPRSAPQDKSKPPQDKQKPEAGRRPDASRRVCFNQAETRDKIIAHHLTEPFRALRAGRLQGEALRARLCRWKQDDFVYEISILRRDGHIVRVYMNAANGQSIGPLGENEHK